METSLGTRQDGVLDFSTFENALKSAEIIAQSSFCPENFRGRSGDILVAMQLGFEIGLKPMQSLQGISVVNGRPCVWGDTLLAICLSQPNFEYYDESFDDKAMIASCTVKRKGMPERTVKFSLKDAQTAGLVGKKGTWQTYPKRMLQIRARGFALRDIGADWLSGIISREEVEDYSKETNKETNGVLLDNNNMYKSSSYRANPQDSFQDNKKEEGLHVEEVVIEGRDENIENLEYYVNCDSLNQSVSISTYEKLMDLIMECEVPKEVISKWLNKANAQELSNLTESQANKIIQKLSTQLAKKESEEVLKN